MIFPEVNLMIIPTRNYKIVYKVYHIRNLRNKGFLCFLKDTLYQNQTIIRPK